MNGKYFINRTLLKHSLWLCEVFSRGQAWIDLVGLARWKDGFMRKRGIRIDIKRGQLGWSQKGLADRWKWSRGKVKRFLQELEKENMIKIKTLKTDMKTDMKLTTIITIQNYDKFQSQDMKMDIRRTSDGHETDMKRTQKNKDNKEKKEYKEKKEISKEKREIDNISNAPKEKQRKASTSEEKKITEKLVEKYNAMFKKHTRVTSQKIRKVKVRLKTYSFQELEKAIGLCSQSEFHKGDNDRGWVADFDYIFRNDEQVDKMLNLNLHKEKPKTTVFSLEMVKKINKKTEKGIPLNKEEARWEMAFWSALDGKTRK